MEAKDSAPTFSERLSAVCELFRETKADYEWSSNYVGQMDRLTQDYLHALELGNLNHGERAKVATKLAKCRRQRREYKDTVEILEPFMNYLNSDKGKNQLNLLADVVGKTRKVETRLKNRVYIPRIAENYSGIDIRGKDAAAGTEGVVTKKE